MKTLLSMLALALVVVGCGPAFPDAEVQAANDEDSTISFDTTEQPLANAFGINGTVSASRITLTVISDKLMYRPSALAFKPGEGSLWVVNRGDDSTVIIDNPGKPTQKVARFFDDSAHFLNNPTQIAFSKLKSEFAVSLDSVNDYNGQAQGNLFTGPTLFTSNRSQFEGGSQSHLDMLHHSPKAMGIAAGARPTTAASDTREYWVFNGMAGSIDRYFFNKPHALGADDHSDGIAIRYAAGQLKRLADVPSHLAFDATSRQLYIADTGNRRVVRLDTRTAINTATRIAAYHGETPLHSLPGTRVTVIADEADGLSKPSGLLVKSGLVVVGDQATGKIKVFSVGGIFKGEVDTRLGSGKLGGLAEGPDGKLYFLDSVGGRVLRLDLAQ
ncbi:MAG: putative secreted protein [Myxococcaceae bacterium]|nr:putative secreted protein [Myxococcaceae bacterium]